MAICSVCHPHCFAHLSSPSFATLTSDVLFLHILSGQTAPFFIVEKADKPAFVKFIERRRSHTRLWDHGIQIFAKIHLAKLPRHYNAVCIFFLPSALADQDRQLLLNLRRLHYFRQPAPSLSTAGLRASGIRMTTARNELLPIPCTTVYKKYLPSYILSYCSAFLRCYLCYPSWFKQSPAD